MENSELPFFLTSYHHRVYKLMLELEFQETVEEMLQSRIEHSRGLIDNAKDQLFIWCTDDRAQQAVEDYVKIIQRIHIEIGHDLAYLDGVRDFKKHRTMELEKAEKALEMNEETFQYSQTALGTVQAVQMSEDMNNVMDQFCNI